MSRTETFQQILGRVADGKVLDDNEAYEAFDIMMSGEATPGQIGAFLMGLRVRGEAVSEIAGGVRVMREKSLKVKAPENAIDNCGTGGDGSGTWNISTGAAFLLAACGVPMAKHGNRALSSKSGTSQALEELGVKIGISPDGIERCIEACGMGFMMAPSHHAAMAHVAPVRMEMKTRTIFNLIGPLSNPAGTKRQLLGVFSEDWVEPLAEVLKETGTEKAWVVSGTWPPGGHLDEITTTGRTKVAELKGGTIKTFDVTPEDAGLPLADHKDLIGGDPKTNAAKLKAMLEGERSAYRDIVVLNAAAGLIVADKAADLKEGAILAAEAIDSGKALKVLECLVATSNADPT